MLHTRGDQTTVFWMTHRVHARAKSLLRFLEERIVARDPFLHQFPRRRDLGGIHEAVDYERLEADLSTDDAAKHPAQTTRSPQNPAPQREERTDVSGVRGESTCDLDREHPRRNIPENHAAEMIEEAIASGKITRVAGIKKSSETPVDSHSHRGPVASWVAELRRLPRKGLTGPFFDTLPHRVDADRPEIFAPAPVITDVGRGLKGHHVERHFEDVPGSLRDLVKI